VIFLASFGDFIRFDATWLVVRHSTGSWKVNDETILEHSAILTTASIMHLNRPSNHSFLACGAFFRILAFFPSSYRMNSMSCWLCGDHMSPKQLERAKLCSEMLPFQKKSVACLVKLCEVKDGCSCGDDSMVCDGCFGLVGKIDQVSYELDVYVRQLRAKAEEGVRGES
jgi:hypothetical protein